MLFRDPLPFLFSNQCQLFIGNRRIALKIRPQQDLHGFILLFGNGKRPYRTVRGKIPFQPFLMRFYGIIPVANAAVYRKLKHLISVFYQEISEFCRRFLRGFISPS